MDLLLKIVEAQINTSKTWSNIFLNLTPDFLRLSEDFISSEFGLFRGELVKRAPDKIEAGLMSLRQQNFAIRRLCVSLTELHWPLRQ